MTTLNSSAYLASYGIAENSLSDDVKDGVKEVLRAAGTKALEQLGPILQAEARKRGIQIGTPSTDTSAQNEATQAALDRYAAEQEAQKKRQRMYLAIGAVAFVLVAVVATYLLTRERA